MRAAPWSLLALTLIVALPGCKRRCKGQTLKYIEGFSRDVCAAEARAFRGDPRYLGLILAKADRPPQRHLPAAPLVVVSPSGVTVETTRLTPWPATDALIAALKRRREQARGPRAHLGVGPEVPVTRVATVLQALHRAGFRQVTFLLRPVKPPYLPPPPDPHTRARLERFVSEARPADRRRLLERHFDTLVRKSRCGPLGTVRATARKAPARERCRVLTREVQSAVERCGCAFDYRHLLTVTQLLFGPYHFLGHFTATLAPDRPGVAVSKHAQWQHVVHKVLESPPGRFWLTPR